MSIYICFLELSKNFIGTKIRVQAESATANESLAFKSLKFYCNYRIQPNYRTMRLGFSKLPGKSVVKYISLVQGYTLTKYQKRLYDDVYAIFF